MSLVLNGSGTITGLSAGGLPDATITQADLAANVAGTGPAFSAYRNGGSTGQTFSAATYTKLALDAENFDTNNCFDSTTNYRFTPTVAGYYQINLRAYIYGTSMANTGVYLFKNGSSIGNGSFVYNVSLTDVESVVNELVYMNGTTDYLEGYVRSSSGAGLTVAYTSGNTCFSGFLARAA